METHDEWKPQAVVLCAGDYPTHALPLHLLRDARHVVCCDGATAEYMQREGRLPWYAVGDGDSLPLPLREQLGPRFIHITEQETNDCTIRYDRDSETVTLDNRLAPGTKVKVTNIGGQTITQATSQGAPLALSLKGQPRGTYLVVLSKGSQTVRTHKLLKY